VRPVHCLIVRGSHATVARSWTPDTRINGRTFDDATLVAGDVLSIGPVDFLVLQTPAMPPAGEAEDRPAEPQEALPGTTNLGRWGLRKAGFEDVRLERPNEEAPPHAASGPEPQHEPPQPTEARGESIEQYLASLLERVRQNTAELSEERPCVAEEAASPDLKPQEPALPAPAACPPSQSGQASSREPDPRRAPPQAARVGAPKTMEDLGALRELANFSAQAALDRHARRRLISLSTGKLVLTLAALACGGFLMGSWWVLRRNDLALYGGAVGLLAALVWGLQHTILTGRILVGRSGGLHRGSAKRKPPAGQEPSVPSGRVALAACQPVQETWEDNLPVPPIAEDPAAG
jgi:hypothetical protein